MTSNAPSGDHPASPRRRPYRRSAVAVWVIAGLVPWVAWGAAWLLEAATVTPTECSTGGGGGDLGLLGFGVLLLIAPLPAWAYGRRAKLFPEHVVVPIVVSELLVGPAIFLGAQLWWSGANCLT